jgi:hypothetical protein
MKHLNLELEKLEQRIAPGRLHLWASHHGSKGSKGGGSKGSKGNGSKGSKGNGSKGSKG